MAKTDRVNSPTDPRKLADEAVRQSSNAIIDGPPSFTDGRIDEPNMEDAFERDAKAGPRASNTIADAVGRLREARPTLRAWVAKPSRLKGGA
jgi:hypothetical protein